MNSTSLEKLRALSLVSATLEIEYMLNTIGEEDNGKPPHEFHFPRKNLEPCLWFLLRSKSSMQRSSRGVDLKTLLV